MLQTDYAFRLLYHVASVFPGHMSHDLDHDFLRAFDEETMKLFLNDGSRSGVDIALCHIDFISQRTSHEEQSVFEAPYVHLPDQFLSNGIVLAGGVERFVLGTSYLKFYDSPC